MVDLVDIHGSEVELGQYNPEAVLRTVDSLPRAT